MHSTTALLRYFLLAILCAELSSNESAVAQPTLRPAKDISVFAHEALKLITNREGLPQSAVPSIAVDSSGLLWIGTQDGAAFYDGRKWTLVNMPTRTVSNFIQSIFVARDGAVWFGVLYGGVHRYADGRWQSYDTSNGLASNFVLSIYETIDSGKSVIWIGTNRGVSRLRKGRWETVIHPGEIQGAPVRGICEDKNGSLWFATDRGIVKYSNKGLESVNAPAGLQGKTVMACMRDREGAMWFGGDGIIGKYQNGQWQTIRLPKKSSSGTITTIYQSSGGAMWFGTHSGVWKLASAGSKIDDASLELVSLGTAMEPGVDNMVSCIRETCDRSLWFGTFLGLYRYTEGRWKTLDRGMGLREGGVSSICATSNGDFWFGTERSLIRYHLGKWQLVPEITAPVQYLFESSDHGVWASVFEKGVYRYKNGSWKRFTTANGLASNTNWFIYQTRDGAFWFGSDRGLTTYDRKKWRTLTTADGLADNTVLCMRQTQDQTLWFGTTKGVSRFRNGKWKTLSTRDGLAGNTVLSICESSPPSSSPVDSSRVLWFGTISSGVSRFNPVAETWRTFNDATEPALSNNVVYRIANDRAGRLYFLTSRGITRFTFAENGKIRSEQYTTEDGLPNNEGVNGSSAVDHRGRIWFGTTEGAAFFDPLNEMTDTEKKPILLENVSLANTGNAFPLKSGIILSHDQNDIFFEYALLSFFKESDTRYQIQLEGYDHVRFGWTNNYKKEYTNLSEGRYVFRVWGKDYADNTSGPVEFRFVILPPWWKTWWFRAAALVAIVALGIVSVRSYTARRLQRQFLAIERERMIERERTRISQDMHDTVGSSLTRIAILSDQTMKEMVQRHLIKRSLSGVTKQIMLMGEIAREVIDAMDEIIWSLSPKHDSLESLIQYMCRYLNIMIEAAAVQSTLQIPETIPTMTLTPDVRRNIFLIFKEAVHNLVKYSHASSVIVTITASERHFTFELVDDGIGFDESELQDELHPHFGLSNMRERAEAIHANLMIASIPQNGTTVSLVLQFPEN